MKLYIKQKLLSPMTHFDVFDENNNIKYIIEEKLMGIKFGLQLFIYDVNGKEVARIEQKKLSLQPTFYVYVNDIKTATIEKKFTMFTQKYVVNELNWTIQGDFTAHRYKIIDDLNSNMTINKEYFSLGDAFALEMDYPNHELEAICCVLAIDCVVDSQGGNGWKVKNND